MEKIVNTSKTRGRLIDFVRKASTEKLQDLAVRLGIEIAYIDPKRVDVKVIRDGVIVDGLKLLTAHCDCTGTRSHCCATSSKVEVNEKMKIIYFRGDATSGYTEGDYDWGYTVQKDGWTVKIEFWDTRSNTVYAGAFPPALKEFVNRGWEVIREYDTSKIEDEEL